MSARHHRRYLSSSLVSSSLVSSSFVSSALVAAVLTLAGPAAASPPAAVEAGETAAVEAAEAPAAGCSDPLPFRGAAVTVTGTGFSAGEQVTASLPSRNRGQLGTAIADARGRVTIGYVVPESLPDGDQEVRLTGDSGATASTGFALRPLLGEMLARLVQWWPQS